MAQTLLLITKNQLFPSGWGVAPAHNSRETNLLVNLSHPLLVFQGCTLASEDDIHFLETQTLGLRHEEPDESRSDERQHAEENVCSVCDVLEEIRGDLSDDEVVHPVTRATKRGSIWACADGPYLSDQDPCTRTPGVTEVDDEEPDHNDGGPSSSLMVFEVIDILRENDGDDQMRDTHADGADGENGLTTNAVNVQYSRNWNESV